MVRPKSDVKKLFYVEQILDHRVAKGKKTYLVKWAGFGDGENSWEPAESFLNSKVVQNYEKSLLEQKQEKQAKMAKSEVNQRRLAPISLSTGFRTSNRQRKPTYKRSLIEKFPEELEPERTKSYSVRSTPESYVSRKSIDNVSSYKDLLNDDFKMPIKKRRGHGGGRPRKRSLHNGQESNSTTSDLTQNMADVEPEEFTLPEETLEQSNKHEKSMESNERAKFDLHPYNGLIGENLNKARLNQLTKEMDEALEKMDGFLIADESNKYRLTRLILIAKRPNGMLGYIRIQHKFEKFIRFECVPLEILIGIHPYTVLEYMQEQMKLKLLEERRRTVSESLKKKKNNGVSMEIDSNGISSTSGN